MLVLFSGYGTFAPVTPGGQVFLVFFALIGIPASGLTLVYLADTALGCATRLFTMGTDKAKAAFVVFDSDGSGELDLEEFREALSSLSIDLTDLQFEQLVNEIDQDGSGEIDQDEFAAAVVTLHADLTEAAGRSNRLKIVVFVMTMWTVLGMVVFAVLENWKLQESFYFSFVTLATIGLGDFFPESRFGQYFLVVFITGGLGMLSVLLTLIEGLISDAEKARKLAFETAREAAIKKVKERDAAQLTRQQEQEVAKKSGDAPPKKTSAWGKLKSGVKFVAKRVRTNSIDDKKTNKNKKDEKASEKVPEKASEGNPMHNSSEVKQDGPDEMHKDEIKPSLSPKTSLRTWGAGDNFR